MSVLAVAVKLCSQSSRQVISRVKEMYITCIIDHFIFERNRYFSHSHIKFSANPRDNICRFVGRMELFYGQDVAAEVYMRVYVSRFFFSLEISPVFDTLISWEISPQTGEKRGTSNYRICPGDENGSRIYQLVLKRMDLLPSNVPAKNIIGCSEAEIANMKGKKRASASARVSTGSMSSRSQKKVGVRNLNQIPQDSDVNMEEVGEGSGSPKKRARSSATNYNSNSPRASKRGRNLNNPQVAQDPDINMEETDEGQESAW